MPPSGVARTDAAFWESRTTIVGLRVLLGVRIEVNGLLAVITDVDVAMRID